MISMITDLGITYLLGILFSTVSKPITLKLRLFVDTQPLSRSNDINTRIIASGGGYEDKDVENNAIVSIINGSVVATFPEQVWSFNSQLDNVRSISGVQVIADGILLWEEMFPLFTPGDTGGTLKITPRCKLGNI